MVFSSIPVYLDPPNWHQHPNQQGGGGNENPQLPPPPPPPQAAAAAAAVMLGSGSMADRARLGKIPQPETPLECPRCESMNTKFCYFNNYSLSQPRHFCKTCRRYWTRGGALRNVPVGGGCRKNKRSKGTRTKSPAKPVAGCSNPTSPAPKKQLFIDGNLLSSNASATDHIIGHLIPPPPHLPFLSSLHHLGDYGSGGGRLNFQAIPAAPSAGNGGVGLEFPMGSTSNGGRETHSHKYSSGIEISGQWKLQQFPFLANLEGPTSGLVPFGSETLIETPRYVEGGGQVSRPLGSGVGSQLAPVKMEANQGLNFSKNFMGISANDQLWTGNAWSELPGFPSASSTNHLL